MKFTRPRVLIILLVLGLIVVYASLISSYVNQNKAQVALRDQIDTAKKTLSLLPAAPADSQKRLDEAQKAYDAALSAVSESSIDSTQVIEDLITTAGSNNLTVNPAVTETWTERTYGLTTYRILPLTLDIKGSHQAIIDYIQRLEDRTQFPYLAIEGLTMSAVSPGNGASDIQQATLKADIINRLTPKK